MTPHDLDTEFIRQWLERGDIEILADDLKVSKTTIRNALHKRTKNFKIVERCHAWVMVRVNKWIAMQEQTKLLKQKIESL